MTLMRTILLVLFLITVTQNQTNAIGVFGIIGTTFDITENLGKVWDLIDQNIDFGDVPIPILQNTKDNLFSKLETINSKLDDLATRIDYTGTQSMAAIIKKLPDRVRLELRLNDLLEYLTQINTTYTRMRDYARNLKGYEQVTLEDFARTVVSHDSSSVLSLVERIHAFVVPNGVGITNTGLFELIAQSLQEVEGDMLCSVRQSPQQVLYHLYSAIALTELKGYTMVQFSYMLLRLYGKGNFKKEVKQSRKRFKERTNNTLLSARKSMQNLSRQLWMCDPKKHIKGETYEEITRLQQGYVINVENLNHRKSCDTGCSAYSYVDKYFGDLRDSCGGKISECRFINFDLFICHAKPFRDRPNDRRYEFITYDTSKVLGKKKTECGRFTRQKSWEYYVFWRCDYCFCMCDEGGELSDRFFNLRSAISNIQRNRVVTGLRFVKNNRIIHLQIQEGELLPQATINASTLSWKPVENYTMQTHNIYDGQDFYTLAWEKRAVDLDDLEADKGYILTGVRFKVIGSHLNFEIYVTKFDFDTGKLIPTDSKWIDNTNTETTDASTNQNPPRKEVHLKYPDIPILSSDPSIPTSQHDQYIKFTYSDIDKDVAQTTVPFLDAQKVESVQAVPLSGAGLFHKGRPGYGGFIAPKVITYDYSKHLKQMFPPENVN